MTRPNDLRRPRVLMIAYTNYENDPRVVREANAAVWGGFDVDVIVLEREGQLAMEWVSGVMVHRVKQARYRGGGLLRYVAAYLEFFLRCFAKVSWMHLQNRYRVVHVNNMPDFLVFCALLPRLLGARVILDIHDPMPDTFASKFPEGERSWLFRVLLFQERVSAAFASCIVTVSEPLKRAVLVEKHGLKPTAIHVIANFADDDLFQLRSPPPAGDHLQLVFHGTILERYGLAHVIRSIAAMRHRDGIRMRIIGDGDYSAALKQLIADLGLADAITFDNRMYPLNEIPKHLADCHLGVVPLERSSILNFALPVKLIEYFSLGMPSITVRNAAIEHYFDDTDCLFYEPEDQDSLRRLLDRVADDPGLVERYRQRSITTRERCLWSVERRRYVDLLRELSGLTTDRQGTARA